MTTMVKEMSVEELRTVIRDTVEQTFDDRLEDLEALSSTTFQESIEEAREDYRAGRTVSLDEYMNG